MGFPLRELRLPFMMLLAAALSARGEEALGPLAIRPTLSADFDYRQYPSSIEGNSGFALANFRPGVTATPSARLRAVGTFQFVAEHGAVIHDAYLWMRATEALSFIVGYAKTPLFPSFFLEPDEAGAFPTRSLAVNAFSGGRDLGVTARYVPSGMPLEGSLRVGNGTGSSLGNDNALPAGYASLDWVGGRGRARESDSEPFGWRIGAGGLLEKNADREGVHGETPLGFVYYRPVIVSGLRRVGEAHAIAYLGPVRLSLDAAAAIEERSRDDDGNPSTPRVAQDALRSQGLSTEINWTLRGEPRVSGTPPRGSPDAPWNRGSLELSARYDGLWLGRSAADVAPGGAQGGAVALKWWPQPFLSASLAGFVLRYDRAPLEDPDAMISWGVIARLGFAWN